MKIKSFFQDLRGAFIVKGKRENKIKETPAKVYYSDPISKTAKGIHPGKIELKLIDKKEVTGDEKLLRFVSTNGILPLFQAGQYLTLEMKIGDSYVTRPYSISSAPYETELENHYIEISVKRLPKNGFASSYLLDEAKIGDTFISEIGLGDFHFNSLLDSKNVVALAGGSGITPFLSMAREIKNGKLDINLTIIHGSMLSNAIFLKEELEECLCDKVKIVDVISNEPSFNGEKGFINKDIVKKYSQKDSTFFICGPQKMQDFVRKELNELDIPNKRMHFDCYGSLKDLGNLEGYPKDVEGKTFSLKVVRGLNEETISANANESIAVALERAGLKIHTGCRSGICGFCRVKVLSGSFFVPKENDMRRATDKEFNYVYACSTYPLGDMSIQIDIA